MRDLPNFTDPPLNEIILSIQFATLSNLKSAHIGLLWERLRSEYPIITEQAPIQTVFETFGIPSPAPPLLQIQTFLAAPLPRYWFERPGFPDLLQIQHDRILHNWRQQSDNSRIYPRYEAVKKVFDEEINQFQQWLSDEKIGELRPNQCEVTYINIITLPEGAALDSCLEESRECGRPNLARPHQMSWREFVSKRRFCFHRTRNPQVACMLTLRQRFGRVTELRLFSWR